jgi:O-antigen/teichoic acid export membrane protein
VSVTARVRSRVGALSAGTREATREQVLVAGAQVAAGVGNLAFSLVAARLLEPRAFAQLTAFLSLYLLVHLPTGSLSAGGALDPGYARTLRRRIAIASAGVFAAALLLAGPLAQVLALPAAVVLVLAATVPAAGLLALERGSLYGEGGHRRAAASLVAEPVTRLSVGVALAVWLGATGGAIGVVLAGYAAWLVAGWRRRRPAPVPATAGRRQGLAATMLVFFVLAVVQKQDVLLANRLLGDLDAALFAVVATIGGTAAFATVTIPTVLLPRAAARTRHALAVAVGLAAALGFGAVAVIAIAPEQIVGLVFGSRYAAAGPLAVPYVAAMAVFGVVRVLVAQRCAAGGARTLAVLLAAVAVAHAAAIALLAAGPGDVVALTAAAVVATLAIVGGAEAADRLRRRRAG